MRLVWMRRRGLSARGQMKASRRCVRRDVLRIVERGRDIGHQRHRQMAAMMMMQSGSSSGSRCSMMRRRRMCVMMMVMVMMRVGGGRMMSRSSSSRMMMMMMQLRMQLRFAWTALVLHS